MARPSEMKDQMWARWVALKKNDAAASSGKELHASRPHLASECHSIPECEKWHKGIVAEIVTKVSAIENAGLGEYRLREINDEINKLIRTKGHWERRIRDLGGNTKNLTTKRHHYEIDGIELPNSRGYKYYGAAKNLPGVRELFDADKTAKLIESSKKRSKNKYELMKNIKNTYWGKDEDIINNNTNQKKKNTNDDISELVKLEMIREKQLIKISALEYATIQSNRIKDSGGKTQQAIARSTLFADYCARGRSSLHLPSRLTLLVGDGVVGVCACVCVCVCVGICFVRPFPRVE